MLELTFDDLLLDLRKRRQVGDAPPAVLLGAGASVESGIEAMDGLFELVQCNDFAEFCGYIDKRSAAERYRLLADYLQTKDPEEVSAGYQALAALCANAFFDIILSTNLDPLLDDALAAANMWRRDYILLVNGVVRADRIKPILRTRSPRVKVIKLHGDLFHRFMAWTPAEMDEYLTDLAPLLTPALDGRDVLVVGHSLRDERIRELALGTGGSVWYTTPFEVPELLRGNDNVRAVVSDDCRFEQLFTKLAVSLGVAPAPSPELARGLTPAVDFAAPSASRGVQPGCALTMDDLVASVVAIGDAVATARLTGFVLAEPRVIVTDGFSGPPLINDSGELSIDAGGRRMTTKVRKHVQDHPFGPLVLEVPPQLKVHGLRLDPRPMTSDEPVHVCVAAGEATGLSSGTVSNGQEQTMTIAPLGPVANVIELKCGTAPGASGAPVVDPHMQVVGFITAGSTKADDPRSFMYPAKRWADVLS